MIQINRILKVLICLLGVMAAGDLIAPRPVIAMASAAACDDVRYLMARDSTPYDFVGAGGVLTPKTPQTLDFSADVYSQFYAFRVQRALDAFNNPQPATIHLEFAAVPEALRLEFALFFGMDQVSAYAPVTSGGDQAAQTVTVQRDGVYTLVVRRVHIAESAIGGAVTLTADFPTESMPITVENLRDASTRLMLAESPVFEAGVTVIPMPSAPVRIHVNGAISVGSLGGQGAQVRFETGTVLAGEWAQDVALLGGDLAARGVTAAGVPRVFYLQDFGHRREMVNPNLNIEDSNGTRITTDWGILQGVWLLRDCLGVKLIDGRSFVAPMLPDARQVSFTGTLEAFTVRINAPDAAGVLTAYQYVIEWHGVAPETEVRLQDGVLHLALLEGRTLALEATQIILDRRTADAQTAITTHTPLEISLLDRGATVRLDWLNMQHFALIGDAVTLEFSDARAELTPQVTRSAVDLLRLEALNDVIQIIYQEVSARVPGEQRLMLPLSEGYIEIITPAGLPTFDSLALPDEAGYAPRALNNLGGECYAVNTTLAEANCPPNGEPNPANGNLWYSVVDLRAAGGYNLDLTLSRSYNSRAAHVNSPFGFGWTTEYLLDYNIPFDAAQGARQITPQTVAAYRVGLDVTYAPRGIVTFTTPSGSRHVFASAQPTYTTGTLNALTMPGWTLTRADVRGNWTLRQSDGLTYAFDRAGRLVSYGYPQHARRVTVDYPRSSLAGVGGLGEEAVLISDDFNARQLELYYDAQGYIVRSQLRDTTRSKIDAPCMLAQHCLTTTYHYQDGLLVGVTYADGQRATYTYDDRNRLIAHTDPYAPIATRMLYTYSGDHLMKIDVRVSDDEESYDGVGLVTWRTLSAPAVRNITPQSTIRAVNVTDEWSRRRTYSYALAPLTPLREVGEGYQLFSVSSPLPEGADSDSLTQTYQWNGALLTQIGARVIANNVGRNSTTFRYTAGGALQNVTGGFLDFDLSFDSNGLPVGARYADGTTASYGLNAQRLPEAISERDGAQFTLEWDADGRLSRRTRTNDGKTWTYTHNAQGLVTRVTTGTHSTDYTWDSFGRLVRVEDALLGAYTLTYALLAGDAGDTHAAVAISAVTVVDPAGVMSESWFDARGRLIESTLTTQAATLRHLRYTYDGLNRLTSETVLVDATDAGALTTRYQYAAVAQLTEADGSITPINGYSITRQDPYGRRETYTYDAFGRIRQVQDMLRQVTRYDYFNSDITYNNGYSIVQTDRRGAQILTQTTTIFDLRGQLREVIRTAGAETLHWTLNTEGHPVNPRFLNAVGADILALTWGGFDGDRATDVQLRPVILPLESGATQPTQRLSTTYDFLGRPTRITDGDGMITEYAYCARGDGGDEVLSRSRRDSVAPLTCNQADFDERRIYDVHQRVVQVTDAIGTRTYHYTRDATTQEWVITLDFSAGYRWELRYNAAGDLTQWRDDAGIVRHYQHDGAGRLIRVSVPDTPESSYTFAYNAAGLLTRQVDDLGRGYLYQYDERGLVLVKQDALTADATTYAYGAYGEMTSAISPLGNTTTFRYDDVFNPTRLTGVTDPTGVLDRFTWDDVNNRLTFADVRGNQTQYWFDALGALWRIDDALGQSHELHYSAANHLTDILNAQSIGGGDAVRHLRVSPPDADGNLHITESHTPDWGWQFRYNSAGRLTRVTDPSGYPLDFVYDVLGRVQGADSEAMGWALLHQPDAAQMQFNGWRLQYDSRHRLTHAIAPTGETIRYAYGVGSRGDTTLEITQDDTTRHYTFSPGDDSSRPRNVTVSAQGQTLTYFYNAEGLIEEFRAEACMTPSADDCVAGEGTLWTTSIRFNYDTQGRPVRIVDQEQNVETFAYDDLGNLIAYQTPTGKTFNYAYDNLNRLIAVTSPTGIKVVLRYNALNQVAGICRVRAEFPNDFTLCDEADRVVEEYTYDALGRLIAQRFPNMGGDGGHSVIEQDFSGGRLTAWGVSGLSAHSVTRGYQPNALGLLSQVQVGQETFAFDYQHTAPPFYQLFALTGAGQETYTYDALNRLSALTVTDDSAAPTTYAFDYLPKNRGYQITRADGDDYLLYGLDERGFLSALDYGLLASPNDAPLVSIAYRLNPRQPNILSVLMNSNDNAHTLDLQINRRGETRNLVMNMGDWRLLVDYLADAVGQVARQRIDGSPAALFAEEAGGYIIVTGYDDDNRPTTVRITDKSGGRLLYVLNFTYNEGGQRLTETRRYADNTQMNIRYEYGTPNQLSRRIIEIVPPITAGIPSIVIAGMPVMLSVPLLWVLRRRGVKLGRGAQWVGVVCGVLMLGGAVSLAQPQTQVYTFNYHYDAAGNLRRVDTPDAQTPNSTLICTLYSYDSANRLTQVIRPYDQAAVTESTDASQHYSPDSYARLNTVEPSRLIYAGNQPFVRQFGTTHDFYGRLRDQPPVWIGGAEGITWGLSDGRSSLLATLPPDATDAQPLRLLDPLGREVALRLALDATAPDLNFNPCVFTDSRAAGHTLTHPQHEFNQLLYADGLYFSADGRAYDPVIGRYLQRDPFGPDVLGSVYDIGQPQPVPVLRRNAARLSRGLTRLEDALAMIHVSAGLDAATIAQAHDPRVRLAAMWSDALLETDEWAGKAALADLLALPAWLQAAYNLPSVTLGARGAILLDTQATPAHGGMMGGLAAQQYDGVLPTIPAAPQAILQGFWAALPSDVGIPHSYDSRGWLPVQMGALPQTWQIDTPRLDRVYTPSAILAQLPMPLKAPQNATKTLRLVEKLAQLPAMTGLDWLETALYGTLPSLPELPPQDSIAWRERWFTTDTLGAQRALSLRQDVPLSPYAPVYGIGYNADWLFFNRSNATNTQTHH